MTRQERLEEIYNLSGKRVMIRRKLNQIEALQTSLLAELNYISEQIDDLIAEEWVENKNAAPLTSEMTFGRKLRTLRASKDLTQEEMASKLGLSRRAYLAYEQDKSKPRNEATYQKMAGILDCDVSELKGELVSD